MFSPTSFYRRGSSPARSPVGDWVARLGAAEAVLVPFLELIQIATFSKRFLGNCGGRELGRAHALTGNPV